MADFMPWIEAIAFTYAAAMTGLVVALLTRWALWWVGHPSVTEAAWCAFLPCLAVILLPLVLGVQSHPLTPFRALHDAWHQWAAAIHRSPWGHAGLHVGNVLVVLLPPIGFARAIYFLAQSRSFTAAIRTLPATSIGQRAGRPVFRIASDQVTCFTLGTLRPAVYATEALLAHLSPREQEAVLAHEAAHIRRRDGLTRTLLHLFYQLFPLPGGQLLCREWDFATERACDAAAARAIGSRCDVATALIQVAALAGTPRTVLPAAVSFIGGAEHVAERVEALLASPNPTVTAGGRFAPISVATASVLLVVASSFWIQHAVEAFVRH